MPAAGVSHEPQGLVGAGAGNRNRAGALGAAPGETERANSSSDPNITCAVLH